MVIMCDANAAEWVPLKQESSFSVLEHGIRDQGDSKVILILRPLGSEVATFPGWLLM